MKVTEEMLTAFNDADFSGCGNADWEDSHIRVGLQAVLDLIDAQERPPVHANPEMIYLNGVSYESLTFEISRKRYEQAKADDKLDHELDAYLSDMDSETYVVEPDGTVVYPYR